MRLTLNYNKTTKFSHKTFSRFPLPHLSVLSKAGKRMLKVKNQKKNKQFTKTEQKLLNKKSKEPK